MIASFMEVIIAVFEMQMRLWSGLESGSVDVCAPIVCVVICVRVYLCGIQ